VVRTGDSTLIGCIAGLASNIDTGKTPLSRELNQFIVIMTLYALTVAMIFFILALVLQYEWLDGLVFFIGIIVANVPEGLLATITVRYSAISCTIC
jgi:sodium/potassium-transporting ATPase subunit alpha